MSLMMHRATAADRFDVQRLLDERAAWLRAKGSRQWDGDLLAPERVARIVERGGTFLAVREDGRLAGTITLSPEGDPDFWTQAELLERPGTCPRWRPRCGTAGDSAARCCAGRSTRRTRPG